jgi:hypothetical protein
MSAKPSTKKTESKPKNKIMGDIIIIRFLDIEPERIILGKTKSNPNNKSTPFLYDGKYKMYVSVDPLVAVFGVSLKTEITDTKSKKTSTEGPMMTGFGMELSLPKDYLEPGTLGNQYYLKAIEINNYFFGVCVENRVQMLDMDETRNIIGCTEQVRGSGDTNYNSLFKSLLNYSRQKVKNSKGVQEIMSEYPPRFKFTFDAKLGDKSEGANRTAAFITQFFTADNVEIKDVTHLNYAEALPKFSEVKTLSYWHGITSCKSWAIVKIILVQVVVKPYQKLSRDTNFLCSDSESSDEEETAALPKKKGNIVNYLMDDDEDEEEIELKPKPKSSTVKSKKEEIVEDEVEDDDDNIDNFLDKEVVKPITKKTVGLKKTTI